MTIYICSYIIIINIIFIIYFINYNSNKLVINISTTLI